MVGHHRGIFTITKWLNVSIPHLLVHFIPSDVSLDVFAAWAVVLRRRVIPISLQTPVKYGRPNGVEHTPYIWNQLFAPRWSLSRS
jgi:hypothetical protein